MVKAGEDGSISADVI